MLVPLVVVLFAAFKTRAEYSTTGPLTPPQNWFNFDNFATAWTDGHMLRGFWNTTIILVVSLTGTVSVGTLAAYAISRFVLPVQASRARPVPGRRAGARRDHPGGDLPDRQVDGPGQHAVVGHRAVHWAPTSCSIYIFIQFMQSIPRSLDQAALIDGASRFTIYRRIILPLMKPAIATVVIIKGIAIYNEFYIPFLYLRSPDLASSRRRCSASRGRTARNGRRSPPAR